MDTWVELGCRVEANWPCVGPWPTEEVPSIGVFLKDPSSYLSECWRNPEWLSRQERPGFEPGTSRLLVLSFYTPPLLGLKHGDFCFINSIISGKLSTFQVGSLLPSHFFLTGFLNFGCESHLEIQGLFNL